MRHPGAQWHTQRIAFRSAACALVVVALAFSNGVSYAAAKSDAEGALSRKLTLLERMVNESPTAKRAHKDDGPANEFVLQARESLALARESMADKRYDDAESNIKRGFQLMARASRTLGKPQATAAAQKQKYSRLRERVVTFTQALERVYKEKGIDGMGEQADLQILRHGIEEAATLAESKDYSDANRSLSSMAEMVEIALTRARHQETLLHELTFESPDEEYAYEKGRNKSYEMLIGLLRNKPEVDETKLRFFSKIVAQNDEVKARADNMAADGDMKGAIAHLEHGTERLAKALRALGLSF